MDPTMTISELIAALQAQQKLHGDLEVRVHCHGCCFHAHGIESMTRGGTQDQPDEKDCLVIEV